LGAEEEIFVAQDAYVHKLEWYEQRARDAFEQTCYQEPPSKAEEGEKRAAKQPPRAKPDAKLLQSGMTAAKAIVEGTKEKAAAKKVAREAIEKCQLQSEDGMVRELYEHCRRLSKQAKKLAALGFEVPAAPAWDWNRIERTIRDRLRSRKRNYQHARWLPDDWQAYGNQLLDLPFDKTPPEVVAEVAANPEPVKSNYVPDVASLLKNAKVTTGVTEERRLRVEAACVPYRTPEPPLSPPPTPVAPAASAPAEAPKPKPVNPSKRALYNGGFTYTSPPQPLSDHHARPRWLSAGLAPLPKLAASVSGFTCGAYRRKAASTTNAWVPLAAASAGDEGSLSRRVMIRSGLLIEVGTLEACIRTNGIDAYMQREASIMTPIDFVRLGFRRHSSGRHWLLPVAPDGPTAWMLIRRERLRS
jgi:hypothetical protein